MAYIRWERGDWPPSSSYTQFHEFAGVKDNLMRLPSPDFAGAFFAKGSGYGKKSKGGLLPLGRVIFVGVLVFVFCRALLMGQPAGDLAALPFTSQDASAPVSDPAGANSRTISTYAVEVGGKKIAVPAPDPRSRRWLVLIGIDQYAHNNFLGNLKSCCADIESLRDLLYSRFGYRREETTALFNAQATQKTIKKTLLNLADRAGENDSVLIVFSGHGHYDKDKQWGIWFAHDAEDVFDGIENSVVRDWCRAFKARHVLVIADSCFSGSLLIRAGPPTDPMLKSREVLSSGSLHPVADAGSPDGAHSVFNYYLRQSLTSLANEGNPFVTTQVYVKLYEPVRANSEQEPQQGVMSGTFHEGGQFLFFPFGEAKQDGPNGAPLAAQAPTRKQPPAKTLDAKDVEFQKTVWEADMLLKELESAKSHTGQTQ